VPGSINSEGVILCINIFLVEVCDATKAK